MISMKAYSPALLLAILLLLAGPVLAAKRIDPRAPVVSATWTSGNLNAQINFCVASTSGANANNPPIIPYTLLTNIGGGAAPFTLASGANTIPITLQWRDLVTNALYALTPNTYLAGFPATGELRNCLTYTFNGRLEISIAAADLSGKPPGTYTRTFNIDVENSAGGGGPDKTTYTITVTIPDSIAVTNVNSILLGTWDGVSNMTATESLCVYRAGGLTYGVMLTGSGAGGAFQVALGSSVVPLQLTWNDGGGAVAASPGTQLDLRTNAYPTSVNCNGGAANNATLGVTALAADLSTATMSGVHTGVITINVIIQ